MLNATIKKVILYHLQNGSGRLRRSGFQPLRFFQDKRQDAASTFSQPFLKVFLPLTAFVLLFIVGCSSPEEKKAKSLAEAAQLQAEGELITALELLEALSQKHPDDSEILKQIGQVHQELGNHSEAAFYLGAAHNLAPDDAELLFQAYLAHENAGLTETARNLLTLFAQNNPAAMTHVLWFRLGELRAQAQKTEVALEAYLEGIKLTSGKPSPEIALAIGTLFKQLNNRPMAGRWLAIAANSDDPSALQALFGLLEIRLSDKNWEAAESTIKVLDKKFPGAVDASRWSKARSELQKWRSAQADMKAQLEKLAKDKQLEQAKADKAAKLEKDKEVAKPADASPVTSGKGQVTMDAASAEAFANAPAIETGSEEPTETIEPTTEPTIVFDPNIIIQPAEPYDSFDDETSEAQMQETVEVSMDYLNNYQSSKTIETPPPAPDSEPETALPGTTTDATPDTDPVAVPDTTQLSLEELLENAAEATSKRNYDEAIQLYWSALGRTNERADIWNALSKVYLIDGQAKNAATTALEATRLAPENIQYLLDYLRVVQRVKKAADFIKELEIAYDRFPNSPEITLSLARGYLRVGGNDYAAGILYRRFIEMAPDHPLRPEAEAALARMR